VTLDQRRFEKQRLADAVGHRVFDVRHAVHFVLDAQRLQPAALLPVLANAVAQVLRLAHVQHNAARVLEQVHARFGGQLGQRGLELGGHYFRMLEEEAGQCARPPGLSCRRRRQ
jgi:hypothetical protein